MTIDGRAGFFSFALCACACACAGPGLNPGAALVDVVAAPPEGSEYREVGPVSCHVDSDSRPVAERRAECEDILRNAAERLGGDVVVVSEAAANAPSCTSCVDLRGKALRRVLPWEKAKPRRSHSEAAPPKIARLATGTAFAVAPDGHLLTALHVVNGARTVSVSLADGRQAVARVVRREDGKDLAVLRIDLATPAHLAIGDSTTVAPGDAVFTLGFPVVGLLGEEPKFTDGAISSTTGIDGAPEVFQMSVPVQPGNSGGPLLTDRGQVVAVVTSSAAALPFFRATGSLPQGINWAVKADLAKSLIPTTSTAGPASSRAEAVRLARAAVCLVEAASGDGLLLAWRGFGEGLSPRLMTTEAYAGLRARCGRADAEGCLAVAESLQVECASAAVKGCSHLRFARTVLGHACSVGERRACDVLTKKSP